MRRAYNYKLTWIQSGEGYLTYARTEKEANSMAQDISKRIGGRPVKIEQVGGFKKPTTTRKKAVVARKKPIAKRKVAYASVPTIQDAERRQAARTTRSRSADARATARKTHTTTDTAGIRRWLKRPGRSDVSGVDTKGKR